MNTVLSVLALLVAAVALALTLQQRRGSGPAHTVDVTDLPADTLGLRHEVAALRAEAASALQHLAVVRYDAYPSESGTHLGGALSWSLALLDDHGDGTVITSIHGRSEARTYAKTISAWSCSQPLSPEEEAAVAQAKP